MITTSSRSQGNPLLRSGNYIDAGGRVPGTRLIDNRSHPAMYDVLRTTV
jgi:hypothetical protein